MKRLVIGLTALCAIGLLAYATLAQPPAGEPGRGGFGPPPNPLLTALDGNRDGEISAAEIDAAAGALKKLDQNDDGKLSGSEIGPRPGRFGGPGMGGAGMGGPRRGMRGGEGGPMPGGAGGASDQAQPLGKTDEEKKTLAVLDQMDRNERAGMMNVPVADGRMLRLLTEAIDAKHAVEIGSSNGYSGIWIALALRSTGGKLTTHDIDAGRTALAKKNYARAGVDKIVTHVFGDAHEEITKLKGPVDLVFIDADKEGYPDYLKKMLPLVRPGGLILAHNVSMRGGGLSEYVQAITTNADLETFFLPGSSLSITLKKR